MTRSRLAALLFLAGCGSSEAVVTPGEDTATTEEGLTDGAGPFRGHEDVTRLAVDSANAQVALELGEAAMFPSIPGGASCIGTENPLLKGNCATDFPDATMVAAYGTAEDGWQSAATIQDLHFLRDHVGVSGAVSAREACVASKARIVAATRSAQTAWTLGDLALAHYWLGHALHVIQDSFSPAHAVRTGTALHSLSDVCTYGLKVSGVCKHGTIDLRDRIWVNNPWCQINPLTRGWDCMAGFAHAAVRASTGYLRTFAGVIHSNPTGDVSPALTGYFEKASDTSGYFDCSTLR